ncbi:Calcium channel yvc1 [Basidiobolus ranarum]|uniref:Calcium channel yvc1 n=1 Tax=Basidiobolus ranarum TaxID=34480 RepID=A0ABR2WLT7_9FUNG
MSNTPSRSRATGEEERQPLLTSRQSTVIGTENENETEMAKRVRKTITGIFSLINNVVPEPVETEDITRCDSTIITKETISYALQVAQLAGGQKGEKVEPFHVIYCTLRCVSAYQKEAEKDASWTTLMQQRALAAQVLAKNLLHSFHNRLTLNFEVLLRKYYAEGERIASACSVIELAIDIHATLFLADYEAQKCIHAIWNGEILQNEDVNGNTYFIKYEPNESTSLWKHINPERLNVPRYQDGLRVFLFLCFLGLYTYVVNNRTIKPEPLEWLVYIWILGYIFEEFRLIYEGGMFYLYSIWHWINIMMYSLFFLSFAFRVAALFAVSQRKMESYNDIAYDLLSVMAVFLWVKAVSLLDSWKFFGNMIIVLQAMIKDSMMFFLLLPWGFIGFFQSFYALGRGPEETGFEAITAFSLLSRAFLSDANFDLAISYHSIYGGLLFGLYLFFTVVLLLNILVALFNSSYVRITDEAEREYIALFTFKVFTYLKSPDQFPFPAPFNLIEVFLIIPTSLVLTTENYAKLNHIVLSGLLWIPLIFIAHHESQHLIPPAFQALDAVLHEQLKSDAIEVKSQEMTRGFIALNTELENGETRMETYQEYRKRMSHKKCISIHQDDSEYSKGKSIPANFDDILKSIQENQLNLTNTLKEYQLKLTNIEAKLTK